MKEEYLHYIFKQGFLGRNFQTTDHKPIKVLDFGEHNPNAGPDFLDAKVEMDEKLWVGPIEFHVRADDWYKHQHQNDPEYQNVIFHFVYEYNCPVFIGNYEIPTIELKGHINSTHYLKYKGLFKNKGQIPCSELIESAPPLIVENQKKISLEERLWQKGIQMISRIEQYKGDRQKAYLAAVARVFGGAVNGLAFETLIERVHTGWLAKLNYDSFRIEALFFGLAGILDQDIKSAYGSELKEEYRYLEHLFDLEAVQKINVRYAKMRPSGFPDIRLHQFIAYLLNEYSVSRFCSEDWQISDFYTQFKPQSSLFWSKHYRLANESKQRHSSFLSKTQLDLILINAVVPYLYGIGLLEGNQFYLNRSIQILTAIPPETNRFIESWERLGVKAKNALDSQSLLALKKAYCNRKKCLFCEIGKHVLKR